MIWGSITSERITDFRPDGEGSGDCIAMGAGFAWFWLAFWLTQPSR